jgi:hypothetical protein
VPCGELDWWPFGLASKDAINVRPGPETFGVGYMLRPILGPRSAPPGANWGVTPQLAGADGIKG